MLDMVVWTPSAHRGSSWGSMSLWHFEIAESASLCVAWQREVATTNSVKYFTVTFAVQRIPLERCHRVLSPASATVDMERGIVLTAIDWFLK